MEMRARRCRGSEDVVRGSKYDRILIKLSGEALAGEQGHGIEPEALRCITAQIREVHELGADIGVVVGGGNVFRGLESAAEHGIERVTGDYIGMLATVINALALQDKLESQGSRTRVMTAVEMRDVAEPFIPRRALRHLEKGRIVVFAGGTGNPFFTTDTAASLRAVQIGADAILKATDVDGVYDKDPHLEPDAKMFDELSYLDVLGQGLKVMDPTAVSLGMDNRIPIIVFNLGVRGNLKRAVLGEEVGTIVK